MTQEQATQALNELYSSWYASLVRYLMPLAGSTEKAEDLAQETFLEFYRALRNGKRIESPKGWTVIVARRFAFKYLEKSRAHPEDSLGVTGEPLQQQSQLLVDEMIRRDEARRLLVALSEREREAVFLRLASMKYREIGEVMGISSGSVATLLSRALRKLRSAAAAGRRGAVAAPMKEDVSTRLQ